MKISIQDIKDYCFCPHYYFIKSKRPDNIKSIDELYDKTLKECFYVYLTRLQNDKLIMSYGMETLKKEWGKRWIKQKKNSDIMYTPSPSKRGRSDVLRKIGIDAIINFYNIINANDTFPIIIDKNYEIQIADSIIITGNWEIIMETGTTKDSEMQVCTVRTDGNRFITNFQAENDLALTAASYAFESTFDVKYFTSAYIDLYNNKKHVFRKTRSEYNTMKDTVKNAAICIKNKMDMKSPDQKCYHCLLRNACMKGT